MTELLRGATSSVRTRQDGAVEKRITKVKLIQYQPLDREVCVLKKLQKFSWAPRLIAYDFENSTLVTSYVGEPISEKYSRQLPSASDEDLKGDACRGHQAQRYLSSGIRKTSRATVGSPCDAWYPLSCRFLMGHCQRQHGVQSRHDNKTTTDLRRV